MKTIPLNFIQIPVRHDYSQFTKEDTEPQSDFLAPLDYTVYTSGRKKFNPTYRTPEVSTLLFQASGDTSSVVCN